MLMIATEAYGKMFDNPKMKFHPLSLQKDIFKDFIKKEFGMFLMF